MNTIKKGNNKTIQLDDTGFTKIAPPAGAIVGNYVWEDSNGNGIQDLGEKGLSGVTVKLFSDRGDLVRTTTTDAQGFYQFFTLSAGNYKLQFVSPLGYELSKKDATVDTLDSDVNSNGFTDMITVTEWSHNSSIDAGMVRSTNKLTGSIGDKVWVDANGNGLQDAGERGLAGVKVELIRAMPEAKPGQFLTPPAPGYFDPVATTKTDANGNYVFKDVPANQGYQVRFTSPDGYQFTLANVEGHARPDNTDKAFDQMNFDLIDSDVAANGMTGKYFVQPGQHINHVDAGLTPKVVPATGSIGNKVWFDANGNGTQDAGEAGMAGVQVKLWREVDLPTDGLIVARPAPVAVVTTDKNGNYNFDKLTAGDYRVEVVPPKDYLFTKANVGNDKLDSDIGTGYSTAVFPLGVGQKRDDIDAGLVKKSTPVLSGSIGDKVWVDANGNGLQDAGERGLAGVKVELIRAMPEAKAGQFLTPPAPGYFNPVATTKTDANGNYVFKDVPANQGYQVRFTSPDGYQFTLANVEGHARPDHTGKAFDQMNFDLIDSDVAANGMTGKYYVQPGQHINHVDAGLIQHKAVAISGQAWSDFDMSMIDGRSHIHGVRDNGESAIANVAVALYDSKGQLVATTNTDKNGHYRFGDLKDGDYKVHFAPQGSQADSYITTQNAGRDDSRDSDINSKGYTDTISIRDGKSVSNVDAGYVFNDGLETFARVGNRVWQDLDQDGKQDNNEPGLGGVAVHAYTKDGKLVATKQTDSNGNFEFKLNDGEYRLHFDLPVKEEHGWFNHYSFSAKDQTHDAHDSDANAEGYTDFFKVSGGQLNVNLDAGMFPSISVMSQGVTDKLPMLEELLSSNANMDVMLPGSGVTQLTIVSHDLPMDVSVSETYNKLFDLTV